MSTKIMKPLSLAVGVAFVGSLAIAQAASASSFSLVDMDAGYQLAGDPAPADKAKEGTCGAEKAKAEGSCGEGKCGMTKLDADKNGGISATEFTASGHPADKFAGMDTDKNGSINQAEFDAAHKAKEGSCGEGKCGADKAKKEGACGADKAKEGACGADKAKEGACGADKAKAEGDKAKEGACGGSL